jgi:hypothetical protein
MRFALTLALLVTAIVGAPFTALAGEVQRPGHQVYDRAFSGPGWRFREIENFREHFRDRGHRHHRPGVVIVSPGRCWQAGHWTYQWVPQAYSYNTWVAGHWSPDGRWIDGHYAPGWYNGGYYQPLWVEGHWSAC